MGKFKIKYNPYKVETTFVSNGEVIDEANTPLGKGYGNTIVPIEEWIDEVIQQIDDQLNDYDVELEFEGLPEHYALIKKAVAEVVEADTLNIELSFTESKESLERKHKRLMRIMEKHKLDVNNAPIEEIKSRGVWSYEIVKAVHENLIEQFREKKPVKVTRTRAVTENVPATMEGITIAVKKLEDKSEWKQTYNKFLNLLPGHGVDSGQNVAFLAALSVVNTASNAIEELAYRSIVQYYIDIIQPIFKEFPNVHATFEGYENGKTDVVTMYTGLLSDLKGSNYQQKEPSDTTETGGYLKMFKEISSDRYNHATNLSSIDFNKLRMVLVAYLVNRGASYTVTKEVEEIVEENEGIENFDEVMEKFDTLVSI